MASRAASFTHNGVVVEVVVVEVVLEDDDEEEEGVFVVVASLESATIRENTLSDMRVRTNVSGLGFDDDDEEGTKRERGTAP